MTIRQWYSISFWLTCIFFSSAGKAQETEPLYIKISKKHKALDVPNGSDTQWLQMETAYLAHVIKKNEFIVARKVLTHYMTDDNSEVLFMQFYKSWEDIEKAEIRNRELEAEKWPDLKQRNQKVKDLGRYYDNKQSDEFFITVPGTMENSTAANKTLFYQLRVNHLAVMDVKTDSQFTALNKTFLEKAVFNNRFIKAYYPLVQLWSTDKRKYLELTAVASLGDLEDAFKEIDVFLYEPLKANASAHSIFIKNYFSYFTGFHADYIYRSIPALFK